MLVESGSLTPGTYALGPEHGTIVVRTGKTGPASKKAGHNLERGNTVRLLDDPVGSADGTAFFPHGRAYETDGGSAPLRPQLRGTPTGCEVGQTAGDGVVMSTSPASAES